MHTVLHRKTVSYSQPGRARSEVEAKLNAAIMDVARGMSMQQSARKHDAPFTSLNRLWVKMGGRTPTCRSWKAFVKSLPPAPEVRADPELPSTFESPLGPRLLRRANRFGDGVPYGSHGPWGLYREGVKEMSAKVASGKVSTEEACSLLSMEGIKLVPRVLEQKAKHAPGKSPLKAGAKRLVPARVEEQLRDEVAFMRKHDVPVTKPLILAMGQKLVNDQGLDVTLTSHWYYGFLDSFDLSTGNTKPLESDRDLWLTSTVCISPKPGLKTGGQ